MKFFCADKAGSILGEKLGTKVRIEAVDLGMLNRVILTGVEIDDQKHKPMLTVHRLAVRISLWDLLRSKASISAAQIFGADIKLYKETATSQTNFQFVLDSLKSKDTTKASHTDVEISSLIIRRTNISYNQLDDSSKGLFSPKHINLSGVSSHIILNCFTNDSLNINIKRLAFEDRSGMKVENLKLKAEYGKKEAKVKDFRLELPHTKICIPEFTASYELSNGKLKDGSLRYKGSVEKTRITPSDFSALLPVLSKINIPVNLSLACKGTDKRLGIRDARLGIRDELVLNIPTANYSIDGAKDWNLEIKELRNSGTQEFRNLGIPDFKLALKARGNKWDANLEGTVTSSAGGCTLKATKRMNAVTATAHLKDVKLGKLVKSTELGNISGDIHASALLSDNWKPRSGALRTEISSFTFRKHNYTNITADAVIRNLQDGSATLCVKDQFANGKIEIQGTKLARGYSAKIDALLNELNPNALGLIQDRKGFTYSGKLKANVTGSSLKDLCGNLSLADVEVKKKDYIYKIDYCDISRSFNKGGSQTITLNSDFANLKAEGRFAPEDLKSSVLNALCQHVEIPGVKDTKITNSLKLYATVRDTKWAEFFLDIPLEMNEPANIIANVDDRDGSLSLRLDALDFNYDGKHYTGSNLNIRSNKEKMEAHGNTHIASSDGSSDSQYDITAMAKDNRIESNLGFDMDGVNRIKGNLNVGSRFYTDNDGKETAEISIRSSKLQVGGNEWLVHPAEILYKEKMLEVRDFTIDNDKQFINISGSASKNSSDKITVKLKGVDVAYIMDMVDFHSVAFDGFASGEAHIRSLFDNPDIDADLTVDDFKFEHGNFGTLHAKADYNINQGDINIDAKAKENSDFGTIIKGYVSPKKNSIDLNIETQGTLLEFLKTYTSSFADGIGLRAWGNIEVVGPLSCIQLVGEADVTGRFNITPLNVPFTVEKQHVHLEPDLISLSGVTVNDTLKNRGTANVQLTHKHLGDWGYNVDVKAEKLLCYDCKDDGKANFWGTVFATGTCNISDRTGDAVITVDATPQKGTEFVYNASSPNAVSKQEFVHWNKKEVHPSPLRGQSLYIKAEGSGEGCLIASEDPNKNIHEDRGNLYMNFMIHATPDATLKVLMNRASDDYISLNGSGAIRTTYYNKGSFDMFGNYTVQSGVYNMTIQNFLHRRFDFMSGGTVSFGGDAFSAPINLQAKYTLPSVSLSDLNIGKSFANNNVKVDCLMNITGTPAQPKVEFSLNMPTISTDAKQMVMSLMNSEEEVNQQAIYLLTVGRFLVQSSNNSSTQETADWQNQTTQAMTSFLNGTISQQLSRAMNAVVKNNNWNLGANISTGNDGWSNAEYEGLVSGKLFNNRLLFNGTFGYRDNLNKAQSSFIGDFDIQYLLRPDGNFAIKAYNQTNDRYFTKNSLTTQGIGLILKRDFDSWLDLFRRKKK